MLKFLEHHFWVFISPFFKQQYIYIRFVINVHPTVVHDSSRASSIALTNDGWISREIVTICYSTWLEDERPHSASLLDFWTHIIWQWAPKTVFGRNLGRPEGTIVARIINVRKTGRAKRSLLCCNKNKSKHDFKTGAYQAVVSVPVTPR